MKELDRREVLRAGAMGAAIGLVPAPMRSMASLGKKTKRVIIVALAGGVRTRETLGTPSNVPNLMRIVQQGVVFPRTRASNLGHFGATLSIFTGISEARGIRDNARGEDPTLFEYLRKDLALPSNEVWVSTSGGAQEANVSYSLHKDYGARYAANTLDGDGIFNAEFQSILAAYGRPREMGEVEKNLLERMRRAIGREQGEDPSAPESASQVERFLLDELKRGTQDLKGLGASDAKAFRVGRNLMAIFRPKLLTVVAREADVAHGNFNSYVQVIRRNDEMLGELWNAVHADPELASSTAFFIMPEFGRDADLNSRRGLDHGDGSDDLRYVSLVCSGPDFFTGKIVNEEVSTIDICSTVCDLAGANPRFSRGKRLPRLLA